MNLFAITSLAVSICCFGLAIFVYTIAKTKLHRIWAFFNLTCFLWAIGTFFAAISETPLHAELSWRWTYGLGSIVPCVFYHFNHSYCELKNRKTLLILYILGLSFVPINLFSPSLIHELSYLFDSIYYNKATTHYTIFLIYLMTSVSLSFKELLSYYKKCTGNKRIQALYFLIGFGFSWSGGVGTCLPSYNFLIYPIWNIVVCFYTLLMTYAIFKHQLMDIRVVIKKSIVYSLSIATVSLLYLLTVFVLEKMAQDIFEYQSLIVSISTAFALGLLFIPIRYKVQYVLDKYFFKGSTGEIAEQNVLLRREVAQAEKHKAVAALASGIAHEVKNPLTALKTFHNYFPEKKNDPEFMAKFNHIAGKELNRIENLVQQLLDFAKPSPSIFRKTDIHQLIENTLQLISNNLDLNKIKVVKSLNPKSYTLNIDPNKIKQALLNIFLNAIEAMPDGGVLTITTLIDKDSHFVVAIEDTGGGITKENLKCIFEPFYSKKISGTGLGLAITESIIQEHRGKIQVKNNPNQGTVFKISLPI